MCVVKWGIKGRETSKTVRGKETFESSGVGRGEGTDLMGERLVSMKEVALLF